MIKKKEDLKEGISVKAAEEAVSEYECAGLVIPLKVSPEDGFYQTSFVIYISDAKQEGLTNFVVAEPPVLYTNRPFQTDGSSRQLRQDGRRRAAGVNPQRQRVEVGRDRLYSMFFHNCYNYQHRARADRLPVNFNIKIEEKNSDSYLSAGEMPLPALYQMLSTLFFLAGCFWVFILKKNGTKQVFRFH